MKEVYKCIKAISNACNSIDKINFFDVACRIDTNVTKLIGVEAFNFKMLC